MRSHFDRRTFLLALPGVAALPGILAGSRRRRIPSLALNHVELSVSDPDRSLEFYQGLLGMPIQARQGRTTVLRIGDGPQYMAIRPTEGGQAPAISRMGIAVEGFDVDGVIEALGALGLTFEAGGAPAESRLRMWTVTRGANLGGGATGTRELFVTDPHGIVIQIVDRAHCGGQGPLGATCADLEPSPTAGLLALRDLNHCTCSVSDQERAVEFYQSTFGLPVQVYQAATPALGVGRGGRQFLMFSGGGDASLEPPRGAINHVCMTVEDFDPEPILATLASYGISPRAEGESAVEPFRSSVSMRMPNRGGAPGGTPELYFTDPDGLRVQLQDTTYCGGGGFLGSACG